MKELALKFWNADDIPAGVRMFTTATAIRWIGWGFAETLIPVFLFSFAGSYAEAGLLRATFDIAFILVLPIAGMFADRMRSTTIIMWGLATYLIVGTGYLLAGLTGFAIFIVIARLFNGAGYAMDIAGRETYFMRHAKQDKVATVFGYFDTITNFWWLVAVIAGIWLVKIIPIHWLLFMMVPTVMIAMMIIARFRRREPPETFSPDQMKSGYLELAREAFSWDWKLKMIVAMNFFIAFAYSVVAFFIPIEMYINGAGYLPIIIMGGISAVPPMMGWIFGKWFDSHGGRVFGYGLVVFGILLALLGFITGYWWQVAIVFVIGMVLELLSVGSAELVAAYSNPEHFGRVDGLMSSISDIGAMVGPLMLGIVIDGWGNGIAYSILALVIFALAAVFVGTAHFAKGGKKKQLP